MRNFGKRGCQALEVPPGIAQDAAVSCLAEQHHAELGVVFIGTAALGAFDIRQVELVWRGLFGAAVCLCRRRCCELGWQLRLRCGFLGTSPLSLP